MKIGKRKNALIIFAKPPVAGLAKTRLIPALGKEGAAQYHGRLLLHTLNNVVMECEWDTHLWCSDNLKHPFFQSCEKKFSVDLHEQRGNDLGSRMYHAMNEMLKEYDSVCIIGSDCPILDVEKIRNSFACLKIKEDVVITPAEDGGYVLLAVKQALKPEIFSNISWGGSDVFQHTLDNMESLHLNSLIQPTLWDIDEPEDLNREDLVWEGLKWEDLRQKSS